MLVMGFTWASGPAPHAVTAEERNLRCTSLPKEHLTTLEALEGGFYRQNLELLSEGAGDGVLVQPGVKGQQPEIPTTSLIAGAAPRSSLPRSARQGRCNMGSHPSSTHRSHEETNTSWYLLRTYGLTSHSTHRVNRLQMKPSTHFHS